MLRALITEEPDDRIGHVRICGGDGRVIGCLYPDRISIPTTREDRHLLVREQPEKYGEPVYQRARRERAVPSLLASREGHEPNGGLARYWEASDKAKRPEKEKR